MVTATLTANLPLAGAQEGEATPQGFPYEPHTGATAGVARVEVFDASGAQVAFDVDGSTYTAAPTGAGYLTLTPTTPAATLRLPARGNPYRFEAKGLTGDEVVAYDSEQATLADGTAVALELASVLGGAVLVPRLPTTMALPGQPLDLMLVVLANGHTGFPADYLQVPLDDFVVTYGPVANADVVASSGRGVRLRVDGYCFGWVTVEATVAGLVTDGDDVVDGTVGLVGGSFELPCLSSSGGLGLDLVPPVVTVTSADPVTGVVTGTASDDVGVRRVDVYDGPVLLATSDPADATGSVALIEFEPLSTAFSTVLTTAPLGPVTAVALDTSGNEAQSEPFLPANVVYVDAGAPAGGDGSAAHPYSSVQVAINAAAPGGTVFLRDGVHTYSQLNVGKPLTIVGESQSGTVVRLTTTSYGIKLHSSDVTLANLTIEPAPNVTGAGQHYGVKVSTYDDTSNETIENIVISDVTVRGFARSEIDMLRVDGAVLRNVTADGMGTAGVGIGIAGSRGVALVGVRTTGNGWGGVGLWVTDKGPLYGVTDVYVDATSVFEEPIGLYSELKTDRPEDAVDGLRLEGFGYAVRNVDHRAGGELFTYFHRTWEDAYALATSALATPGSSTVQLLDTDGEGRALLLEHYLVGPGMSRAAAELVAAPGAVIDDVF